MVLAVGAVAILVTRLGLKWPVRAGAAALLVAIAIFFVPRELHGWQPYAPEAVATGRPGVIDFSADWCLPCLELERRPSRTRGCGRRWESARCSRPT